MPISSSPSLSLTQHQMAFLRIVAAAGDGVVADGRKINVIAQLERRHLVTSHVSSRLRPNRRGYEGYAFVVWPTAKGIMAAQGSAAEKIHSKIRPPLTTFLQS